MAEGTLSRRERHRRATVAEIHAAARKLLVEQGAAAVTVNAVARELGMSGPALYHYYSGHDSLVGAVTADFFRELTAAMEDARDALADAPIAERLLTVCRAMRAWAVSHPAEFRWVFATPITPADRVPTGERHQAALRFEQVLLDLVVALWETRGFPAPDPDELPAELRGQLTAYSSVIGGQLPWEAAYVFLNCWIRVYGLLCMEVTNQLDFAYTNLDPVFEACLADVAAMLDVPYSPPRT